MRKNHERLCAEMRQRSREQWRKPRRVIARFYPVVKEGETVHSRSIKLESGGTLTVTANVRLLELNKRDLSLIFSIADKLHDYIENAPILINWQEVVSWGNKVD